MYKYFNYSLLSMILFIINSCVSSIADYEYKKNMNYRVEDFIYMKNQNKDFIKITFYENYVNGKHIFYEIVKEGEMYFLKRYDVNNNLLLVKKLKDYEYETFFYYNFNKNDTLYATGWDPHNTDYQTGVEISYDNQKYYFTSSYRFISLKYSDIKKNQFSYLQFLKGLISDYEIYFNPKYITPFDESYDLLEYLRNRGVKVDEEFDFNEHLRLRGFKEDEYRKK